MAQSRLFLQTRVRRHGRSGAVANKLDASPRSVGSPARFWSAPVFWRFGIGGEPSESARGLAQSKTLPRDPQVHGPYACEKTKGGSPRTSGCACAATNYWP